MYVECLVCWLVTALCEVRTMDKVASPRPGLVRQRQSEMPGGVQLALYICMYVGE